MFLSCISLENQVGKQCTIWCNFENYMCIYIYSQFSLFVTVMFYKVTSDSELSNTEPFAPKGNTKLGFCELLVTIFSRTA